MTDFVLVHGAWHGAWCWKQVLAPLRAAGHRGFAPTLGGVGERAHQGSDDITLSSHLDDVLAVIEAEELDGAILVGHSYAGMVITGVAFRLAAKAPGRLAALVYLDAVVPRPGESWSSTHPAETQRQRRDEIARTGVIAPADPALFGLEGAARDWVARHMTPQPGAVYDAPLHFDAQRLSALRRVFIDCTEPALPTIAASRSRVRAEPGWEVLELATGHDAMVSAPDAVARALAALA
jgi:pimeloyl-ACP methyl ester carboxylesterase